MQRHFPAAAGLLLCALAGCQSYAPYGPGYMNGGYSYGPPTYAPTYGSAPVNGTVIQGPPGTVYTTPGRMAPTPAEAAPLYTPSNRAAPHPVTIDSNPLGGQRPAPPPGTVNLQPNPVPRPIDAGPVNRHRDEDITIPPVNVPGGTTKMSPGLGADPLGEDDFPKPTGPMGAKPNDLMRSTELIPDDKSSIDAKKKFGRESFLKPSQKTGAKADPAKFDSVAPSPLNPYGFDREGYAWLRGKLDFDQIDKRWHITYSTLDSDPSQLDKHGGSLTLSPHKSFDEYGYMTGDVVFIQGKLDTAKRDRYEKPVYTIQKIVRLEDPRLQEATVASQETPSAELN